MVSVGTIIWLSSELMFFAGLFAMYFTARARAVDGWPPEPTELNLPYATVFTVILVASSVTCQFGVFAAEQGNVYGLRRWFTITFAMGLIFVLGQANEYRVLVTEHGTSISSSTYGSVFFLTTGFHALHVIGGLVAFVFLLIRPPWAGSRRPRRPRPSWSPTTGTSSTSCGSGSSPRST